MSKVASTSKAVVPSGSRLDVENPFTNPLVLSNFFEHCPVDTLKTCRLVSKQWLEASTSVWRNAAVLRLSDIGSETYRCQAAYYNNDLGDNLSGQHFRNYKLLFWDFTGEDTGAKMNYWKTFGPFVTGLTLSLCEFGEGQLERLLFSDMFPNLKTLVLNDNEFKGRRYDEDSKRGLTNLDKLQSLTLQLSWDLEEEEYPAIVPMLYKDFFERISNISVLNIAIKFEPADDFNVFEIDALGEMLDAIVEIRGEKGTDKLNIQHLDIINVGMNAIEKYPQFTSDKFQNLHWGCKSLKLDIGYDTVACVGRSLLEPHAQYLEELTLFRLPYGFLPAIPFGIQMPNLRNLHLLGALTNDFFFLKYFWSLKVLHVFTSPSEDEVSKMATLKYLRGESFDSDSEDERDTVWPKGDRMIEETSDIGPFFGLSGAGVQLQELQGDFKVENLDNFRKLTEWFPNVRKLNLPLTNRTFPFVCQRWRHSLQVLCIPDGSEVDDEIFTGGSTRNWNITFLTKLTHLKVGEKNTSRYGHTALLTEAALNDGILLLPELQSLFIVLSSTVISDSKLDLLKSKIKDLELWGYDTASRQRRRLV